MKRIRIGMFVVLLMSTVLITIWWQAHDAAAELPLINLGVAECDAAQTNCVLRNARLDLHLQLGPPVRPLQRFRVQLRIEGAASPTVISVAASFQMRDMDMGVNVYRLQRQGDTWIADVVLPVCSSGRQDWLATLQLRSAAEELQAVFPFATQAH